MRVIALIVALAFPAAALAQPTSTTAPTAAPSPAAPAAAGAPASAGHYTVDATDLGTLLDDPAAKAVLEKDLPGTVDNPQIDMARGMTLKDLQQYAPDQMTDQRLAKVNADLAALPPK